MKVLIITEFFPTTDSLDVRGGVEIRTWRVAKTLSTDHQVTVIAVREPGTAAESQAGNIRIIRPGPISAYRQGGDLMARLKFAWAARQAAKKVSPDCILAENFGGYVITLLLPKAWRQKTFLTYHDVWIGEWIKNVGWVWGVIGEVVERWLFHERRFRFIANSHVTKDKLVKQGITADRITVIYTGIESQRYQTIPAEQFQAPTIVTVARLVTYKRIQDLLEAMVIVVHRVPTAQLVVIGSGPEASRLQDRAKQLGIFAAVQFRGFVPRHDDVLAAIRGATVFSLPSAVEGFGLVTAETMACGTPYVSSDIPPTREVTNDGQGGKLYPVGDVHVLAKYLIEFLTNLSQRSAASQAGRERAQAFDWALSEVALRRCIEQT